MKLGIFCNFSHRHVGGSETVIKQVSERLANTCQYSVKVYSFSVNSYFCENNVEYFKCKKGDDIVSQVNENEHIWIYSDSFWGFDAILQNIKKIKPDVSVALVGAYHMQFHPDILRILQNNKKKFNIITHSSTTIDYKWALYNCLEPIVIPNGIDLSEFDNNAINFREKYGIKEKYLFLNVGQFFYGKGQELISSICKIGNHGDLNFKKESAVAFVFNTIQYKYGEMFLSNCRNIMSIYKNYFFRDLPREDVVAAFKCADAFVFASKKEVSPLVILESQAAGLPWVSMNVGDVKDKKGGIVVEVSKEDMKGYKCPGAIKIDEYVRSISKTVYNKDIRKELVEEGRKQVLQHDWSKIYPLYDEVFKNGKTIS